MAIMATDMALIRKWKIGLVSLAIINYSGQLVAGEWQFIPSLSIDESYSDNVELVTTDKDSSLVTQYSANIDSSYESRLAQLSINAGSTYATYSHNHDLDDDFKTLSLNGRYHLWSNGPSLIARANVQNVTRNSADNSLADLVSGDTVESRNYSTGIAYQVDNSDFSFNGSSLYSKNSAEDNLGEFEGITASLTSQGKLFNSTLYWQTQGSYSERKNNGLDGKTYIFQAIVGASPNSYFSPFLRVYDEDSTGSISVRNSNNSSSLGPGLRWKVSSQLILDLSYNYVDNKNLTDDYVDANVSWQPSNRTSLTASISERFYGKSYSLNFKHRTKRLTNSVSYNETIQAFDRSAYQSVLLGTYLCPIDGTEITDVSDCILSSNTSITSQQTPAEFELRNLFALELVEGNEFSLNKSFKWNTLLKLSRTEFSLTLNNTERESLRTGQVDETSNVRLSITRKISGKSSLQLTGTFDHKIFNKNNPASFGQDDYYRAISSTYSKDIATSLTYSVSLRYLDRNSSNRGRTYNEARATFNIRKDF